MVKVQIPEDLDTLLAAAADRHRRTKAELLRDILSIQVEDESLSLDSVSETRIARLKESISQIKRGEVVTSEQVDQFFTEWLQELDAR
jgi:predicted transcriptional regulator